MIFHARDALTPSTNRIVDKVKRLISCFDSLSWETEDPKANSIVRDISRSVLRDGRFQSYLALGGPAWLHDRLAREATC